jgi:hypothetical protein
MRFAFSKKLSAGRIRIGGRRVIRLIASQGEGHEIEWTPNGEGRAMTANQFRFEEYWEIPGASAADVYDVLSRGELLPRWWTGVYKDSIKIAGGPEPCVGDRLRVRARGFLPYELNFVVESLVLEPNRRVVVRTMGDFDGLWTADISERDGGVRIDLVWEVSVLRPILRRLAPLLRPLFAWNHRWTTPRGEAGLIAFLAQRRAERLGAAA